MIPLRLAGCLLAKPKGRRMLLVAQGVALILPRARALERAASNLDVHKLLASRLATNNGQHWLASACALGFARQRRLLKLLNDEIKRTTAVQVAALSAAVPAPPPPPGDRDACPEPAPAAESSS